MEETFSKQDSMSIIEQMIKTAKNEHREKGEGWLLWGWLLFVASSASAILVQFNLPDYVGWVWLAMSVLTLIAFFAEFKTKKTKVVKTYVKELLDKFSTGFLISLFVIIAATSIVSSGKEDSGRSIAFAFGYFFILYAFWMYIHGSAIRFKPLIVGAFVNWAAAIVIFIIKDFKYAMIISAIAVAIGYLIPGYLLRNQYKNSLKS